LSSSARIGVRAVITGDEVAWETPKDLTQERLGQVDPQVAIVPGRSSGVRISVIARVLKQYVELATGDKFNFDGCSRGGHD
jgi:hypothetical protein